ncbi:MAG TPA: hypothetical protein VGO48_14385 [Conexibacter sp.]|jgi:hypothetical protein|nr:hypothetical protein [Conexibacter sp.]
MRRHRHRLLLVAALLALAPATLPASASALAVTVTGDDGNPLAVNPAAPPSIRTLRPLVGVAADAGTRYSVAFGDPAGKPPAATIACQDGAAASNVQLPFRGNGRYTVAVATFAAGDVGCTLPAGPATSFGFTIAGRVVLSAVGRFAMRDPGRPGRVKRLSLPVNADPGSQTREVRFVADARLRRDGSIRGKSLRAPYANGSATLTFPAPGRYTVVARDAADGIATPWSEPQRIRVVTPFDLTSLRYPDTAGPVFRALAHAIPGTTGVVRAALARGDGAFRVLGRARVDAAGTFGARFVVRRAGTYRLRFTYRGNDLVTRGEVVRSFRVGTAIVGT